MPDYQRIVDDLRNALQQTSEVTPSVLALLSDYREACRVANDRLRQCEAMLRQGLRGEAIQLAEIEPNLLDTLTTLDFPEREQYADLLQRQGQSLPVLYAEAAAELNEAYAAHQPLETLLGRHRYLALAGGSLRDRLGVLRRIAEVDPMNPVWNEDVAAYEVERLKEVQAEANRAITARDLPTLEALYKEMKDSPWICLPPSPFIKKLKQAAGEVRKSLALDELQRLERELNLAHASLDVPLGRSLRERWTANATVAELAADSPLALHAAPALEWLSMQDARESGERAFQQAVADLEHAFDVPPPPGRTERVHLEALYHAAGRHGYDLPVMLQSRYQARIEHLELGATRKLRLRVFAAAGVLLLLGGGIAYGVIEQMHSRQVDGATTSLAALVEQAKQDPSRFAEVESYLAKLTETKPTVAEAASIQQLATAFRGEVAQEQSRANAFRLALERAQKDGPQNPDRAALEAAAQHARLDEEKGAVARFEAEIALAERTMQAESDNAFIRDVQKLSQRITEIERMGFRDLQKLATAISLFESEQEDMKSKHHKVSGPVSFQIQPINTRLAAIKSTATRMSDENAALQAITRSVGRQETYIAALTKFANDYPNGGRADDLKKALTEAAKWSLVETWNQEDNGTMDVVRKAATAAVAQDSVDRIRASAKTVERFPHVDCLNNRADYLQGLVGRRDESGLSVLLSLENSFANPLLTDLWLLTLKSGGERYYLPAELKLGTAESQAIQFVEDYSGKTRQTFKMLNEIAGIVKAPHCAMSAEVLAEATRLKQAGPDAWEPGIKTMIDALYKAEQAEPVLRLALLKRVVEIGCQGSLPLQQALQTEQKLLENTETNLLVNWMKPGDGDAQLAAETAKREWKKLTDLSKNAATAIEKAADLRNKAAQTTQYEWIGWLLNEPEAGWRCATNSSKPPAGEGRLMVMTPDVPSGPIMQAIGRFKNGALEIQSGDTTLFVEGRPVWAERVQTPK